MDKHSKTADDNIQVAFKLNFLLSRLLALETPSLHKQTMWDQVEDPLACMKALSNFYSLIREIDPFKSAVKCCKKLDVIQHIVHYKLLAILHVLTRRLLKDEMPTAPLHVSSFLLWIKKGKPFDDIDLLIQLKEVVAYLRPDLDIAELPSEMALIEQKQETLFNYPRSSSSIKNSIYSFGNQTIRTGLNLNKGFSQRCT